MKKRLTLLAIWVASCCLLFACGPNAARGSGKRITESRQVRGIDRVSLAGSGEVILAQGDGESLTVETDDNLMQYVVTQVNGGTLTLGTQSGVSVSPTRLRFTLTVEDLDGMAVSGSGEIDVERFEAGRLEIEVSGSGNVRIGALAAQETEVQISGSGNVELAGQVTEQAVTISGSGEYQGGDLASERASVTIGGSGNATLWAAESLDARVTGSGSVNYYGDPTTNLSSSGSGKVRRLGGR
jgi:predicted small secreted protein